MLTMQRSSAAVVSVLLVCGIVGCALAQDASTHVNAALDDLDGNAFSIRQLLRQRWPIIVSEETGGACPYEDTCDLSAALESTIHVNASWPDDISFDDFVVKTRPDWSLTDRAAKEICALDGAEDIWRDQVFSDPTLSYQFFGSQYDGTFSIFPAYVWDTSSEANCRANAYDPRFRPWYSSAVSGPKDAVLLLDVSGSMFGDRLTIAKKAAKAVLRTLTQFDYVAIVAFSSTTESYDGLMLPMTDATRTMMNDWIDGLNAVGETDMGLGFTKVFDILEASKKAGSTSNCHSAILFLTDGQNTGEQDPVELVAERNTNDVDARLFTYALGEDADENVPRTLACDHKGIFYSVGDDDDTELQNVMASYYTYFATGLELDQVRWSEVYLTTSGVWSTTGGLPIYDETVDPKQVYGVVAVDVLVDSLRNDSTNANVYTNEEINAVLVDRGSICPVLTLSDEQIEELRPQDSKCNVFPVWAIILLVLLGIGFIAGLWYVRDIKLRTRRDQSDAPAHTSPATTSPVVVPAGRATSVRTSAPRTDDGTGTLPGYDEAVSGFRY